MDELGEWWMVNGSRDDQLAESGGLRSSRRHAFQLHDAAAALHFEWMGDYLYQWRYVVKRLTPALADLLRAHRKAL
jgi:hypothetical protein